ncbi:hypothetical protein TRVA0_022S00166 [Trichomonascus vanleenenianus]|uniref:uncharacterized protein n=1 Tax=Trichomonascus vanleenenianus TaxID=2268995 RepID=UPI003ECADC71
MSVLTSSSSFSFPDRLADEFDSGSGESSMTSSTLEFTVPPQKQLLPVQITAPENMNQNAAIANTGLPRPGMEKRLQNVVAQPKTINGLIRSDIEYRSEVSNASKAAHHVIQTITYYTVMHRLHRSLERFYTAMCDKSRAEPNKFASAYQQAIDLSTAVMNNELPQKKHHNFMALLKTNQKVLLNSFLTLVKSSPSFIASALLSMPTSDLNNFTSHSADPFDDLSSLSRSRPLDILFYSFFPTDAPDLDRSEYFATICAQLLDHHKGERLCYEVFDKMISLSGSRYGPSLEILLLGLLQDGSFLTFPSAGRERSSSSASSSSPSSEFSSPELGHATLATQSTTSLNSLCGENRTQQFFETSVEKILEFLDNPAVDAIPQQFLQFSRLVLGKVQERTERYALGQIVVKYFFHRHAHKLFTLPENFGLLKSSYINDIQRQRILLPLHQKLCRYISTAFPDMHHSSTLVSPKARMHIDSIVDSFVGGDLPTATRRDPTKNSTQLIVLVPSDVVCLYTSLFPSFLFAKPYAPRPVNMERKSSSTSSLGRASTGSIIPFPESTYLTTATSFVSTIQNPYLNDHNYAYSSTAINSSSAGLAGISDLDMNHNVRFIDVSTVGAPAFDAGTSPISEEAPAQDNEWSLEDIKNDVEPVIEEMMKKFPYLQFRNSQNLHTLRANKIQTFRLPHPLTERWQVFEVSPHGAINDITPETILEQAKITRGTSMLINPNFGHETYLEERADEALPIAPANRGLFNQVKNAVEKIVIEVSSSCYPISYYGSNLEDDSPHISCNYILNLLSDWLDKSVAKAQYLEASEFSTAILSLKKILPNPTSTSYSQVAVAINNRIISLISREKEQEMSKVRYQISKCQEHSGPYEVYLTNAKAKGEAALTMLNDLRTKIWYVTEIRPSPLWNRAKDVARALTNGGNNNTYSDIYYASTPTSEQDGHSAHSPSFPGLRRNHSSSSLSSASVFSLKRLTSISSKRDYSVRRQTIMSTLAPQSDGMFAPKEYAGENKLNDREAKATNKWLEGQKIENLCTGEERIHRFCCEVDDLVRRIMGDALSTKKNRGHSLLTTSALFKTDLWRLILEVEGVDRTSTPSIHRSSTYHVDLDVSDIVESREMKRATSAFERTQNTKSHRAQKSSPNLIDIFSSMDIKPVRKGSVPSIDVSPHDSGFESSSPFRGTPDSTSTINSHRRNRSLNDSKSEPKFNTSSFCQDSGYDLYDDFDSSLNGKRTELENFILDLQMRLTGMIYTDIGLSCWYEGSETDKWLNSSVVTASVEREVQMRRNMQAAIAKNAALQASKFKLGDLPDQSSIAQERRSSSGTHRNNSTAIASISESSSRRQSQHATEPFVMSKMPYSESSETLRLGKLATPSMESLISTQPISNVQATSQFCHDEAYKNILHQLSVVPSPLEKLQTLYTLEMLVVSSISGGNNGGGNTSPGSLRSYSRSNIASMSSDTTPGRYNHKSLGKMSSSSAITSLGEVIASVEAKRLSNQHQQGSPFFPNAYGRSLTGPSTDTITEELRRVFTTRGIKSCTLFRDLQFIAAFVPPSVLDMSDIGKAFWDVSLAALSMKQEILNTVVDASSEIFQYASGMITTDMDHEFLSQWSLEDCAWLWSIAAKEGDTTGQRELAIMHLSHPHITPLCLMPFSMLSEVFGPALLEDSKIMDDLDKCDPIRMAVVRHWMERAASSGDNIANEYLMQQSPNGYI